MKRYAIYYPAPRYANILVSEDLPFQLHNFLSTCGGLPFRPPPATLPDSLYPFYERWLQQPEAQRRTYNIFSENVGWAEGALSNAGFLKTQVESFLQSRVQ